VDLREGILVRWVANLAVESARLSGYAQNELSSLSRESLLAIRHSTDSDLPAVDPVDLDAFGPLEGPGIVDLVRKLLRDEAARPVACASVSNRPECGRE